MIENNTNSYYALVDNELLHSDKEVVIVGEIVHRDTELPRIPSFLYGTNPNDVSKIVQVVEHVSVGYDYRTTRQSVRSWVEVEELIMSRSIRIIVWEGSEELSIPSGDYRILSPELFELLTETSNKYKETNSEEDIQYDETHRNGKVSKLREVQNKVLDLVHSNQDLSYYEDLTGLSIKARVRDKDIYSIHKEDKYIDRAERNWKEKGKTPHQWLVS